MTRTRTIIAFSSIIGLTLLGIHPEAQTRRLEPAALSQVSGTSSVKGSGTFGQLPKWIGASNPSVDVGNSIITETDSGHIGIGTTAPGSKLTVAGIIETTTGGVRFPDGSLQTKAALTSVTGADIVPGSVVKGLNGLTDNVTLAAGAGLTLTPAGNTITIAQSADSADLSAFQATTTLNLLGDDTQAEATMAVPFGKRFVIEYVNIDVFLFDASEELEVAMITGVNGVSAKYAFPLEFRDSDAYASLPVKIYSDTAITVKIDRLSGGQSIVRVNVSGHLVDVP